MRTTEFTRRSNEIEHPLCEWCGAHTWLTTIEPHKANQDKRTFECFNCRNVVTEIVETRHAYSTV